MKRIAALAVIFSISLIFAAIFLAKGPSVKTEDSSQSSRAEAKTEKYGGFFGVWLSYLELRPDSASMSRDDYVEQITRLLSPSAALGVRDVFVQVRPFADAVYPSQLFPSSSCVVKNRGDKLPFDFLSAVIEAAHGLDMRAHAWINPYRGAPSEEIEKISPDEPLYALLEQGLAANGGDYIYLNPSSPAVRRLICDGVRELLCGYSLAGIHIDDYFYPPLGDDFDSAQYSEYLGAGGKKTKAQWRRDSVSLLLKQLHSAVKAHGSELIFSVSPGANLDELKNSDYADAERWLSEEGYCDMLIVQAYFGFDHETMPFKTVVRRWLSLERSEKVRLCFGLAVYKCQKLDRYALSGSREWTQHDDIISRQLEFLIESGAQGAALYSASYVKINEKEINNLMNVLYS